MAVRDVIFIGVVVFAFAIAFFTFNFMMNKAVDGLAGTTAINSSEAAVTSLQGITSFLARLDYVIFAVFMIMVLGLIITGWFIAGNPIFMAVYSIIVVLAVIFSTLFANLWETVTQSPSFGTTVSQFPLTNNIMLNLPVFLAIVGFIGIVVMFGKPYFQGE